MAENKNDPARVLATREVFRNRWMTVEEKDVTFAPGTAIQQYYSLRQGDYVSIFAETPEGKVALVRQFRPAVANYIWELPAGLMDVEGESPELCCRRELQEETGLEVKSIAFLGSFFPDTGRMGNRLHVFHVQTGNPPTTFVEEPGISVGYFTRGELREMIRSGKFPHLLHIAAVHLVMS